MKKIITAFLPSYPHALIYMLQSTEYRVGPYIAWYLRIRNFRTVAKRRVLDKTKAAKLLLAMLVVGIIVQIGIGIGLVYQGLDNNNLLVATGIAVILSYPFIWAFAITLPLLLGRIFIVAPKERRLIKESEKIFANHPGIVIGIAGSYGKTTVKELLGKVLGSSLQVAVTPANKNVAVSHALFARGLSGDEKVLVIEYGEGKPGDVARFAKTTQPDIGIITGIAPAHLDQYPTLKDAENDIFALAEYLNGKDVYVNKESPLSEGWSRPEFIYYSRSGVGEFTVTDISVSVEGTDFTLSNNADVNLRVHTGLLGRHMVGPVALVCQIGLKLGMTAAQVTEAVAGTTAYEHRMQPRLVGGGWIIDDTYNGNIEGMRAGLELLKDLPAKRKIYVTPGLVDQGVETERVHHELGRLISESAPDKVVLMQNSTTSIIKEALTQYGYKGEVDIQTDPLDFYVHIDHFIAAGDLIMMQNDWTDNYA